MQASRRQSSTTSSSSHSKGNSSSSSSSLQKYYMIKTNPKYCCHRPHQITIIDITSLNKITPYRYLPNLNSKQIWKTIMGVYIVLIVPNTKLFFVLPNHQKKVERIVPVIGSRKIEFQRNIINFNNNNCFKKQNQILSIISMSLEFL